MAARSLLLALDDQPDNLLVLEACLGDDFQLECFTRADAFFDFLAKGSIPELILLDVVMPGMDGFSVCRQLKADSRLSHVPVIFLTSSNTSEDEVKALAIGAADFVHKPISPPVVLARVSSHLALHQAREMLRQHNETLERMVEERAEKIREQSVELLRRSEQVVAAQSATISAFCSLVEARDNETGHHIRRTQFYVLALCNALSQHPRFSEELTPDNIHLIFRSAPLHDIGKVGIPDRILLKPGKLDADEWAIMKTHVNLGEQAIAAAEIDAGGEATSFLRFAREIALSHHEKWDGSGYPQGLQGDDIPVSARLMAVADVYDALISARCYKPAFSHEKAMAILAEEAGRHFDPDVLAATLQVAEEFKAIAERFKDEPAATGEEVRE